MESSTESVQKHPQAHYPLSSWLGLKKDYKTGQGTLAALCRKWAINYNTARNRAEDEEWGRLRMEWARKADEQIQGIEPGFTTGTEPVQGAEPEQGPAQGKLGVIDKQLAVIDKLFHVADSAKDLESLAKAQESLLNQRYLLTHGARPGQSKPSRRSAPVLDSDPTPIPDPNQT